MSHSGMPEGRVDESLIPRECWQISTRPEPISERLLIGLVTLRRLMLDSAVCAKALTAL